MPSTTSTSHPSTLHQQAITPITWATTRSNPKSPNSVRHLRQLGPTPTAVDDACSIAVRPTPSARPCQRQRPSQALASVHQTHQQRHPAATISIPKAGSVRSPARTASMPLSICH
ncbi:hypothetical protein ACLOJK_007212 [Asimina triloba]